MQLNTDKLFQTIEEEAVELAWRAMQWLKVALTRQSKDRSSRT